MSFYSQAAGLGRLDVSSSLGEPLVAEVELLAVSSDELASLVASIASEEAYAAQGIERLAIHNSLKLELAKNAGGLPMLKLSSSQAINDPYLDVLIQLDWATGRLQREYTVLLDPPKDKTTESAVDTTSAQTTESLPSLAASSDANVDDSAAANVQPSVKPSTHKIKKSTAATPQDSNADAAQVIKTKAGDNLTALAKQLQLEELSLDQILLGLYEYNKTAFIDGNMNRLKVGQIIKVPAKDSLNAVSTQQARKLVKLHAANWHSYRSQLASSAVIASPSAEKEQNQSSSGDISTSSDKAATAKQVSQDVLKLSTGEKASDKAADDKITALKEEATARENTLKEANERTLALEKQIQDMKKLLAMKNQSIADLQKNAKADGANSAKPTVETSVLDGLTNAAVLTGALAALLLGAVWLFLRKNRKKSLDARKENQYNPEPVAPLANDIQQEDALQDVKNTDLSKRLPEAEFLFTDASEDVLQNSNLELTTAAAESLNSLESILTVNDENETVEALAENAIDKIDLNLDFSTDAASLSAENSTELLVPEAAPALPSDLPQIKTTIINTVDAVPETSDLEANRFDLSSISFDLQDTESELVAASPDKPKKVSTAKAKKVIADSPEIEVKLELVSAYIDMGDKEGARELLEEVVKEGGDQQKLRAKQLLDSLA